MYSSFISGLDLLFPSNVRTSKLSDFLEFAYQNIVSPFRFPYPEYTPSSLELA
jgi:hypothetical protein